MNPNQGILDALGHIAESYRSQGVVYKYKAYRTAIDSIRNVKEKITDVSQVTSLPGVGTAMVAKIREILSTGQLAQEKQVMSDPINQAIHVLTSIHGVGPVLAKKLVNDLGLRSLDDLRDRGMQHLPPQARLGLKYLDDTSKRVPYDEIEDHLRLVKHLVTSCVDPQLQICVCGSHRRGAETSGDIDILVTHPATGNDSTSEYVFLEEISRVLREEGYVVDTLAEGRSKFMGFCRLHSALPVRRLDMRWLSYDSFFPALLYFTGSDMFNVMMRTEALKRGYSINEYGIYEIDGYQHLHDASTAARSPVGSPQKNRAAQDSAPAGAVKGKRVEVRSEQDIFRLIGMPFVEPSQRNR